MKKTEKIFVLNPSENNSFVLTQKTVELEVPAATTAQVTQNEEFARTCRICATTTDYAVPIFTGEGRQNNLCEKIETHLPIMVSPEDHLPQQICVSCAHTLLAWHELVACCRQANDALHMRLHQMQQEQEPQPSTSRETRSQKNKAQKRRILTEVVEEQDDLTSDVKETKLISEFTDKLDIVPSVTVAEDGKKYIECEICKKSIISASWKRHLRCHRGEKRYSCHSCGLCFSDSGNLTRHTRAIHSNQRPYSCPICHKTFSRNSHLQDHVRSHSETREFVCDLCGKASKSSAALRMHRKVHLNACYTCVECGAKFRRIGELRAHALVHSGQRDHRCTCGKGFRLRGQLTRHRRTCQSDVQDET